MPEKAWLSDSVRSCRGHCTSRRRNPSEITGDGSQLSCSQFEPVRLRAHLQPFLLGTPRRVGSQLSSFQASPPSPHCSHLAAPELEYIPGVHGSQAPPLDEYLPASQSSQPELSDFENLPALHFLHTVAPYPSWNLPAGHWSHVLRPSVLENFPGVHWPQIPFPFEDVPLGHRTHTV